MKGTTVPDPVCQLPDGSLTFGTPDKKGSRVHVPDVQCHPDLGCADLGLIGELKPPPPGVSVPPVRMARDTDSGIRCSPTTTVLPNGIIRGGCIDVHEDDASGAHVARPVRQRARFTG